MPGLLPDDPDSWTDEQWIEWLEEVDAEADPEPTTHPLRHGGGMAVQLMGAAMLGLHQAIYGEAEPDIVMVVDADGDDSAPPERLTVHLDHDDFDASTVTVRPWIEDDGDIEGDDDIDGETGGGIDRHAGGHDGPAEAPTAKPDGSSDDNPARQDG